MALIKVKVQDALVSVREGVSKAGKPYKMTTQENIFVELNGEIRKVPITMQDGQTPYAAGNYSLDPSSLLTIGQYGFEIVKFQPLQLVPVVAFVPKQANA